VQSIQPQIDQVFLETRAQLLQQFPGARVRHVGSTALSPALTRGTIDIDLAVDEEQVAATQVLLDDGEALPNAGLPTRVVVHALGQPSERLKIRQTLAENPLLLGEFVGLQKRFVHRLRKPYPLAKAEFFETLTKSTEFASADATRALPYRVELETERLTLRTGLSCDAEDIAAFRLANRDHIEITAGKRPNEHYTAEYLRKNLSTSSIRVWRKEAITFLVRKKSDESLIGICNFSGFHWGAFCTCELGYLVGATSEGKGYMSEACAVALDYICSEWGVHRVQAVYDVSNTRSAALAKRLGLSVVGTAKDYISLDGNWRDGVIASLVR
jgi:ribosomal-protein-alanine N-acetyltransferase